VQLAVTSPLLPEGGWTPIRISLVVAWACLLVTSFAAAMMLHSVVALSERRGAFVSAVTHELRTPLTTFRMYAEMLAGGMVPEADQRQRYLDTLRVEADRLAHLVENVLQYARLERGRPGKRREQVSLASLLDRCESRLAERAAQAEMTLVVEATDADRDSTLATDSAAVEQILFNLVDNACKYAAAAADKRIHLEIACDSRRVRIAVRDHGPGISRAGRKKLFQPFSKSVHEAASTAPGVGLTGPCRRLASDQRTA
jgi:signal transduction histidine kinase